MTEEKTMEQELNNIRSRLKENERRFMEFLNEYKTDRQQHMDQMQKLIEKLDPISKAFEGSKFSIDVFIAIMKGVGLLAAAITALIYLRNIIVK